MRQLFNDLFGIYSPVRQTNGEIVSGLAGVDWVWIFGVITFIIVLSSVLKLIAILLRGR